MLRLLPKSVSCRLTAVPAINHVQSAVAAEPPSLRAGRLQIGWCCWPGLLHIQRPYSQLRKQPSPDPPKAIASTPDNHIVTDRSKTRLLHRIRKKSHQLSRFKSRNEFSRFPKPQLTPKLIHQILATATIFHRLQYTPRYFQVRSPEACARIIKNKPATRAISRDLQSLNDMSKLTSKRRYCNTVIITIWAIYQKTKTIPQHLLIPFIRAVTLNISQLPPSNLVQINKTERIIDFVMCLFEKLTLGKEPVMKGVVKNMQNLVLNHGSAIMRHRLISSCKRIHLGRQLLPTYFSRQVLTYSAAGEMEPALLIMSEAASCDIELLPACNEIIIHKLLDAGELEIASQILRTMSESPAPIYSRLWGHYLAAATEARDSQALEWAWDNAVSSGIVSPSNSVHYTIASTFQNSLGGTDDDAQESRKARLILDSVQALCSRGLDNDPLLVSAAAEALARQGAPDMALRLLISFGPDAARVQIRDLPLLIATIASTPEMSVVAIKMCFTALRHSHTHPNAQTLAFNVACAAIIQSKEPELVHALLRHMLHSTVIIPQAKPTSRDFISNSGRSVGSLYDEPTSDFVEPNCDTLELLIEYVMRSNESDVAATLRHLYFEMVPYRIQPSRRSIGLLINGLVKLGEYGEARELLQNRDVVGSLLSRADSEMSYLGILEQVIADAEKQSTSIRW